MSRVITFSLLFFLLASALLWWSRHPVHSQRVAGSSVASEQPTYEADDVQVRRFDENGNVALTVRAQNAKHYADEELTDLKFPSFTGSKDAEDTWGATANEGILIGTDKMTLVDKVVVTGQSKDNRATRIETETLILNLVTEQAETNAPVRILGSGYVVTGIGIDADLRNQKMQIHDQVRAIYDAKN